MCSPSGQQPGWFYNLAILNATKEHTDVRASLWHVFCGSEERAHASFHRSHVCTSSENLETSRWPPAFSLFWKHFLPLQFSFYYLWNYTHANIIIWVLHVNSFKGSLMGRLVKYNLVIKACIGIYNLDILFPSHTHPSSFSQLSRMLKPWLSSIGSPGHSWSITSLIHLDS